MELDVTIEIWQKGIWFVAKCPELDLISQGRTREEARKNLLEVIEIQFEEMKEMGSLYDYLAECGFEKGDKDSIPRNEMVEMVKHSVRVT